MKKVMVDSGHYPNHANKGQTGYREYQGVWKISNYLKEFLEKQGVQADLTKTYEETFNNDRDLTIRGKKAQNYDLFISEHTNAHNDTSVRGVECFYDFSKPEDKIWAEELTKTISELMNNPNRGAKTRTYIENGKTLNYYGVIRGASATNCPHIFLIESGFHSNLIDEAFLKVDDNLKKIAEVQAKVICKILGVEYKEGDVLSYEKAINTLKTKVKLSDDTIKYLEDYSSGEDLVYKISQAVNGEEVVGKPKIDVPIPSKIKPIYKKYSDSIHEIKGEVEDLGIKIVDKKIWDITEITNIVNGTYYWHNPNGTTYATSILYQDGTTYQDVANHYYDFGTPQSVFIVYKDNVVDLKRINFLSELNLNKVRLVIGGLGLVNTQDKNFKYSPVAEGFKAGYRKQDNKWVNYSDVLRKTNKTVLGYNKRLNKIYLLVVKNVAHSDLINIITDNSSGEAYDFAISLDSGGSSFLDFNHQYIVQGEKSRRIHNVVGFGLD